MRDAVGGLGGHDLQERVGQELAGQLSGSADIGWLHVSASRTRSSGPQRDRTGYGDGQALPGVGTGHDPR